MPGTKANTLARLQLDMPVQRITEIDKLVELTGVRTRREFVDQALLLFSWAVKETLHGRVIGSIDKSDGGYREVIMPSLATLIYEEPTKARTKEPKTYHKTRED